MTEDLNTPMLHMRLPSRGSKILRRVTMDTLITAKLNLTRAKDAIRKSDSDWIGGHGMFNNFRIALDKAMADTNDDDLLNY